MVFFQRRYLLRAAFLFLLFLAIPYGLLAAAITTKGFRDFAQSKVSEFLGTQVKIGRIRPGFLNSIVLSDFQIAENSEKTLPGIQVKKIIFRYRLTQLLTREFQMPAAVILKSPKVTVGESVLGGFLLQGIQLQPSAKTDFSEFRLAGGEIRYQVPLLNSEIILKNIRAVFSPGVSGRWKVFFRANLEGVIQGVLDLTGDMNPFTGERSLRVKIIEASLSRDLFGEAGTLEADVKLKNELFWIEKLEVGFPKKKYQIKGTVNDLLKTPRLELLLETKGKHAGEGNLSADFKENTLKGLWRTKQGVQNLSGKVFKEGHQIRMEDLKADDELRGASILDFDKGTIWVKAERGTRRAEAKAKIRDTQALIDLKLDHADIYGIDTVTSGKIVLASDPFRSGRKVKLDGSFETDYLILDTAVLQDFKGDFELSSEGLRRFVSSWGKGFKASGEIKFTEKDPELDLAVRVNGFDLKGIKKFAQKPLPKELGGVLSGKMKVTGPARKPRYAGRFTVKEGRLGRVDFEKAIIQFDGLAPSFKLIDSRVYRGRGELLITGGVDLLADNILHDVKFETQDHLVLYRGLDITLTGEDKTLDLEVHPGLKHLPAFGIKAGQEKTSGSTAHQNGSKEQSLEAGPRFRF